MHVCVSVGIPYAFVVRYKIVQLNGGYHRAVHLYNGKNIISSGVKVMSASASEEPPSPFSTRLAAVHSSSGSIDDASATKTSTAASASIIATTTAVTTSTATATATATASSSSSSSSSSSDACCCSYYTPKNILVTGGAGFVGSHVCELLCDKYPQYRIVVLDKMDYCASAKTVAELESRPNFKFVRGDITDADIVNYLLEQEGIDTILHFAAQSHVDNSFGNSLSFTKNNVLGTHILLEAARRAMPRVRRVIHVSTDEVYGGTPLSSEPAQETGTLLAPTNPYAATKACAEMLVQAYARSYGLPIIVSRGNNVYGPRQYPEKLIPKFLMLAVANRPLPVHGMGNQSRSFIYAADAAEAFDVILHRGCIGETYNIATDIDQTVLSTAASVCSILGRDVEDLISHVEDRLHQDVRYRIDDSKLRELGWQPRTSWREGLEKTAAWYAHHADWWPDVGCALHAHATGPPGAPGEDLALAK